MNKRLRSRLSEADDTPGSGAHDSESRYLTGRVGGALAGAALGAIVGPAGAIALAVTGSLVGGEYEKRVRGE